ncbi:MAG: sel1 repeat family protein [Legionellales bacterium]|nr:sel1 repeat family protein [Legionellales bacterium]
MSNYISINRKQLKKELPYMLMIGVLFINYQILLWLCFAYAVFDLVEFKEVKIFDWLKRIFRVNVQYWVDKFIYYGIGVFWLYLSLYSTGDPLWLLGLVGFISWLCVTIKIKGVDLMEWLLLFDAIRALKKDRLEQSNFCTTVWDNSLIEDEKKRAVISLENFYRDMPLAQGYLGLCYLFGNGVKQDHAKAWEYCFKASKKNNSQGLFGAGYCLEHGLGVQQNLEEALAYYKKVSIKSLKLRVNNKEVGVEHRS